MCRLNAACRKGSNGYSKPRNSTSYDKNEEGVGNPSIAAKKMAISHPGPKNWSFGHIRHLPLPMLACRSRTFGTHTAVDNTSVALPVAIRRVVVGIGVRCAGARFEKGGRGAVGHALFWVVADWTGTPGGFYEVWVSLCLGWVGLRGGMALGRRLGMFGLRADTCARDFVGYWFGKEDGGLPRYVLFSASVAVVE